MSVERHYEGREQTFVKLQVLRRYLERLAHIIGYYWDTLNYVDCFSGPWQEKSPEFEDASFDIALKELQRARLHLADHNRQLKLRCYFLEKDPEHFARLKHHAESVEGVEVCVRNAALEESVEDIVRFCRMSGGSSFSFVFVDPTGWKGLGLQTIAPLLQIKHSEVLINFMTSFVRRFVDDVSQQSVFDEFFGGPGYRESIVGKSGLDRDDALVSAYMDNVRKFGQFDFVCPAIVLGPQRDATHFHLIYGTRHPKGVEEFKKVEEKSMKDMEDSRATAQQRKRTKLTGTEELFAAQAMHRPQHYENLRARYLGFAKVAVESALQEGGIVSYDHLWEIALSFPLTWERDLKEWIGAWKSAGRIELSGLSAGERTPKRKKNHQLRWR